MNKEFEYRGHKFNIEVLLNTWEEERIGDKRLHTIIVTNDAYCNERQVEDVFLMIYIKMMEREAKQYVDEKLDGKPSVVERLSNLGFK